MKSLFVACFLLLSTSAFAQYFFPVSAQVRLQPHIVSAVVSNPFYEPVECMAVAYGRLNNGQVVTAHIRDIVPMGQVRYANVFSNIPGLFFVNGWAEAQCRFLRY